MIIKYRRQISPKQYETEEITVEYEVAEQETILDAFADVKAHVLGQLGLPYAIDNEGIVREVRHEQSIVAARPQPAPQSFEPPIESYTPPGAPIPPAPVAAVQGVACHKCGGETWDNRADNQENRQHGYSLGPDFKCKNRDCGAARWPQDFEAFKHLPKRPR